jgi:thermostable 8-oxoguanine DNA glycosylase
MKVERISKGNWRVEVTGEDSRKITCIVRELKQTTCLPKYGLWKGMNPEQLWEKIIAQFCAIQGTKEWKELKKRDYDYRDFIKEVRLDNLVKKEDRLAFLRYLFERYRPHRYVNKIPVMIDRFLNNQNVLEKGKFVLFDGLQNYDSEDDTRDFLVRNCFGLGMKSVSDFMIEIGMAKTLMAFDTRIIGLLRKHFGLKIETNSIPDTLYKKLEEELRGVCRNLDLELSLLDRMLYRFAGVSAIDYILETKYSK